MDWFPNYRSRSYLFTTHIYKNRFGFFFHFWEEIFLANAETEQRQTLVCKERIKGQRGCGSITD